MGAALCDEKEYSFERGTGSPKEGVMDDDKNVTETRYVLWGLLTLMALAGVILLAIALLGSGLSGGPS